ncbi:MAG: hypothetical protein AB8H47_15710 [Bacteroidia bacterium]
MYRLFQRFTPAFLRKLDHQLLVSRPGLWATRVHYLLFYWLMGAGLASLLLMLMPIQLHDVPEGKNSTVMLMIVSAFSLLAWAVQLAHYQPWKQGESHWRLHAFRDQGIYFLGVGLLLLLPLGFYALHQQRVDFAVADSQLDADMDEFESLGNIFHLDGNVALETNADVDEMIQGYQVLAAKYGSKHVAYSLNREDMLHKMAKGKRLHDEILALQSIRREVNTNFRRLERAERPILRRTDDRLTLFAVWASFGLVLLLFVRSSWQTFLLSIISGLGLLLVESLIIGIVLATDIIRADEEFVVLMLGLNWLVLGGMAFLGEVKSSRQQQIRMIALSLFTVLTTIIPAIAKEMLDGGPDREALLLYIVSCGITFILWNLLFQGRMLQLVVSPKKQ